MKFDSIFYYVMALLEGALSGVVFYEAEKTEHKQRKILLFVASAAWFLISLVDSLQGGLALRELLEEKKALAETDNGGEYDE